MFNPERPPEFTAQRWLNSESKITLKSLRGRIVFVAVAQITCPGSVKYGLPQALRIRKSFTEGEVAVLGLNMAFEKFDEQTPDKVQAFLADSGITIPVALDKPNGEGLPQTMSDYELQGTPAVLLFDRQGRLRRHYLGAVDDLRLGAEIMGLLMEDTTSPRDMSIAIESKLHAALADPHEHEHHTHDHGDNCGCGHDHAHDPAPGSLPAQAGIDEGELPGANESAPAHGEPGHVHGSGCKH